MKYLRPIFFIAIVILLVVLYHRYFRQDAAAVKPLTAEKAQVKPVKVQAAEAFTGELAQYITASGVTRALQEIQVKPLIGGLVMRLSVRDGQFVPKGALLAQLDDREYRIAWQEARAKLFDAQAQYALRKQETPKQGENRPGTFSTNGSMTPAAADTAKLQERYQTAKRQFDQGEISQEKFLLIEREYHTEQALSGIRREELIAYQSGLSAAEAQANRAKYLLENCRITAPFAGIIGDVEVNVGAVVSAGQVLMRLVNLNTLKLRLQVLESELGAIRLHERIEARFAAFPDTVFPGRIVGINPTVDPENRTGAVIAKISNPKGMLKSGMFATIRIVVNRYANRLLVPRPAVIERDQRKLVFIVRQGKAFWCYVESGLENDDYIEVVSSTFALKPGERVIVEGHFALAHNAPVEVESKK